MMIDFATLSPIDSLDDVSEELPVSLCDRRNYDDTEQASDTLDRFSLRLDYDF